MDERVFRRLYALQGIMSNALGHNGAANPRSVAAMALFVASFRDEFGVRLFFVCVLRTAVFRLNSP